MTTLEQSINKLTEKVESLEMLMLDNAETLNWVTKDILIKKLGIKDKTINNYVVEGKIAKRGIYYSLQSYKDYYKIPRKGRR